MERGLIAKTTTGRLERIKKNCRQRGARIFGLGRVVPIIGLGRRSIPSHGAVTEAKRSPRPKRPLPLPFSNPAARLQFFFIRSSDLAATPCSQEDAIRLVFGPAQNRRFTFQSIAQ